MDNNDYVIDLNISKFIDAEIHQREVDGKEVDCISIPIEKNGFKIYKKGNVWGNLLMKKFNGKYGCTHYLKPLFSNKQYKELCEMGWQHHIAFIGNAKLYKPKKKPCYDLSWKKSLDDVLNKEE